MILPGFRPLGRFVLFVMADFYIAMLAGRFVNTFWAAARLPTFFAIAAILLSFDTAGLLLQFRRGRQSSLSLFFIYVGLFTLGFAVALIVGGLIEHRYGSGWGYMLEYFVFIYWGMYVLVGLRNHIHANALQEESRHPVSAAQEIQQVRRYFHPYI